MSENKMLKLQDFYTYHWGKDFERDIDSNYNESLYDFIVTNISRSLYRGDVKIDYADDIYQDRIHRLSDFLEGSSKIHYRNFEESLDTDERYVHYIKVMNNRTLNYWIIILALMTELYKLYPQFNLSFSLREWFILDYWIKSLLCIDQLVSISMDFSKYNISNRSSNIDIILKPIIDNPSFLNLLILWSQNSTKYKDLWTDLSPKDKVINIIKGELALLSDNTLYYLSKHPILTFDEYIEKDTIETLKSFGMIALANNSVKNFLENLSEEKFREIMKEVLLSKKE